MRLHHVLDGPADAPVAVLGSSLGTTHEMWEPQVGSLSEGYKKPDPEPSGEDVAALLDAAEDIVNTAAPDILSEFEKKPRRFGKRKTRK